MKDYSDLTKRVLALKRASNQMIRHEVPSKAAVRRMGKGAFLRKDLAELAKHPAGLNMYTAKETGCRVATDKEETRLRSSSRNANTTEW